MPANISSQPAYKLMKRMTTRCRTLSEIRHAELEWALTDEEIIEMFRAIDKRGRGMVTLDQMNRAARDGVLGFIHSQKSCSEFMASLDEDGVGRFTLEEFRKYIRLRERVLMKKFELMDTNNKGVISADELVEFSNDFFGCDISKEQAQKIIDTLGDREGTDTISHTVLARGAFLTGRLLTALESETSSHFFLHNDSIPLEESSTQNTIIAALVAGAVSRTLTAPLDRVAAIIRAGLGSGGIFPTLCALARNGGVRALWVGNGMNCLTVGPESAILSYAYNWLKPYTCEDIEKPTLPEKFFTAGLGGWFAMTCVYPLHVIKERITLDTTGRFKNFPDFISQSWRKEGMKGFYRAYYPYSVRTFPYRGINAAGYAILRDLFFAEDDEPTLGESIMLGSASAAIGECLTAPFNTARVRGIWQGPLLDIPENYRGVWQCLNRVYRGEASLNLKPQGWPGVFRGMTPNVVKTAPAVGIQMVVFEAMYDLLSQETENISAAERFASFATAENPFPEP